MSLLMIFSPTILLIERRFGANWRDMHGCVRDAVDEMRVTDMDVRINHSS